MPASAKRRVSCVAKRTRCRGAPRESTGFSVGPATVGAACTFTGTAAGLASVAASGGNNGRRTRRMIGSNPFISAFCCLLCLNGVYPNCYLLPVRAVTDCQARDRPSPTGAQVNDAPRKLRRRDASRHGRRHIGEGRRLNLLAAPNLLETPGNQFAHNRLSSVAADVRRL